MSRFFFLIFGILPHISEQFSPDFLVTVLNQYFSIMDERIRSHKGIIDKYIGDAIMAIFGAPVQHDDDPDEAIAAAFAMKEGVGVFNAMAETKYGVIFRIGIGINTGKPLWEILEVKQGGLYRYWGYGKPCFSS